jgi:hypothetical protein
LHLIASFQAVSPEFRTTPVTASVSGHMAARRVCCYVQNNNKQQEEIYDSRTKVYWEPSILLACLNTTYRLCAHAG